MKQHILFCDDDEDVATLIVGHLAEAGYRVTTARDGPSVRDVIDRDKTIQLAILDCLMPGGDRGQTLALHARSIGVPAILISGAVEVVDFAKEHNFPLLLKPFRLEQLLDAIKDVFASDESGKRDDG